MLTRLRRWTHSPPLDDPIARRLVRPLRYSLFALLVAGTLGVPLSLTFPGPPSNAVVSTIANIVMIAGAVAALVLLRAGQIETATVTAAVGIIVTIALNLVLSGLARSQPLLPGLAIPLIIVGLIARRRWLLFVALMTIGAAVVGGAAEVLAPLAPGRTAAERDRLLLVTFFTVILSTAIMVIFLDRFSATLRETLRALVDSEEQFRLITENLTDLVCTVDREMRFDYVGPAFRQRLGYDPAALRGSFAFADVHPDDLPHVLERWEQIAVGQIAHAAFRYRHATTGEWHWFDATGKLTQRRGALIAVIVGRDVTEQRRLEAQLIQAQKMEGIGRLAGGVAHDFNNLLVAITGYTSLIGDSLDRQHPAHRDLHEIRKAADRAANLTRQLLAFARRQRSDPQVIRLDALLVDMDALLNRLVREDIVLVVRSDADLWPVLADVGQIEQVIINLVVNARDAMPSGGELVIEATNAVLDEEFARTHPSVAPGPHVMLAVRDTGVGIDAATMPRLFEPFFTTKPHGQGSGLGLATCYGIVKQHGGSIWAESELGRGATFRVYLPRAAGSPVDLPPRAEPSPAPGGSETILVVEDDAAVRDLVARVLRAQGYVVIKAADGEEALALARAGIALLITDIVMPRMGGRELAGRLSREVSGLRVLYTSGYADDAPQPGEGEAFLQKPFTPEALAQTVRAVLDS